MNITELKRSILKELEAQRTNVINRSEMNNFKAHSNIKYKNLANNLSSIIIDIAKTKIKGGDTTSLEKEKQKIESSMEDCLKEIGLSPNDLKPNFNCKICNDVGTLPNGEYCQCFNKLLSDKINSLNAGIKKISFKNCELLNKSLVEKINTICNQYPNQKFNKIIFSGATGVGKTHLTLAMTNYFTNKNIYTIFISSAVLNQQFLKYHTAPVNEKQEILNDILDCDVLIIDDLGTEPKLKNVTNEYLLYLINYRNAKNKLTIITTNLTPTGILETYDERIFSRLFDKTNSLPILVGGEDKRIK